MNITYTAFPLLLFCSYDMQTAPEDLLFEVFDIETHNKLSKTKGFGDIFSYMAVKNSNAKANTTVNYHLSENTFKSVEYDDNFRMKNFNYFFSNYVPGKSGCIMFADGGTYVYCLKSVQETKALHKEDGRMFSVAFFNKNLFLGFEEGIIKNQLSVKPTGIYVQDMPPGGYLSFCSIVLGYAMGREKPVEVTGIKEKIILL